MATYQNIVDEFQTIAEAFTSVNHFLYGFVSDVNGRLRDKDYPMVLVKSSPNTNRGNVNNDYLSRGKQYTFDIFLYNTRDINTQKTKSLQQSQAEVDEWLDQYIAEFIRRNIDGSNGFSIVDKEQINGFLASNVHNDKLVQAKYTVTVKLDSNCQLGTFTY